MLKYIYIYIFVSKRLPRCIQIVFTPGAEIWAEHYLDRELWLCEAQSTDGYETQRNQQAETLHRGLSDKIVIAVPSNSHQLNNLANQYQEWEMKNW